jgi:nicotinamidase/pyrazinamidase
MSKAKNKVFGDPEVAINALLNIDAANDFSDAPGAALPVPGGCAIGPVIGNLQEVGKQNNFFDYQVDVRDAHAPNFFSFACNNMSLLRAEILQVQDRNGTLHTILPKHMVRGTWGWQHIPGIKPRLFDKFFFKGEEPDVDQFSIPPHVIAWLLERGVTDVYVTGLVKRVCVGTSVINLHRNGLRVHLISDATADLELPNWANVLDIMHKLKIHELSSSELLEYISTVGLRKALR